ncbi:hypothetical protein Cgig2_033486 [Carnegiea gigantea]|uniref:Uncharacterized protein n=1 Tax=Carnegiea gigantea TaxID=171969 RepID=A0A9Q1GP34_9CARY|nr:hypothetical protein Cgig2_033486 [Carnegiea gigantea]
MEANPSTRLMGRTQILGSILNVVAFWYVASTIFSSGWGQPTVAQGQSCGTTTKVTTSRALMRWDTWWWGVSSKAFLSSLQYLCRVVPRRPGPARSMLQRIIFIEVMYSSHKPVIGLQEKNISWQGCISCLQINLRIPIYPLLHVTAQSSVKDNFCRDRDLNVPKMMYDFDYLVSLWYSSYALLPFVFELLAFLCY